MHRKFLYTLLIFMLVLGVMPVAAAELPTAPVLATDAAPQAQPSHPERQMPPWVRELSAAELAGLESQTSDPTMQPARYLPQALGEQAVSDEKVMLVIQLEQAPLAAYSAQQKSSGRTLAANELQSYRHGLETTQAAVQSQIEALGAQVVTHYTTVYNGFMVYASLNQVGALRQIPGVVGVHRAPKHVPALGTSVPLIGAPDVWDKLDYDGTDVVIAVIDTGIDYTHAVFGGSGDPADFAGNDPDIIEAGTFPTAKVIAGYDFAGTDYDADAALPIPVPDRDPLDEEGHGTHVASIAAGMAAGDVSSGVAPGAKLMALKVFGADGTTNLVMNALDMATSNYLLFGWPQVINMSLGSPYGPGDAMTNPSVVATNNAVAAGIVVVASAGNSGNVHYVTGSPGTADKAIGVASSEDGHAILDGFKVTAPASLVGVKPGSQSSAYDWSSPALPITGKLVVPEAGADPTRDQRTGCYAFDDTNKALISGNIVLLNWTTPSCGGSVGRSANAVAAGAIGVLLVDDSEFFDLSIFGSAVVPAYSIPRPIGDALKAALAADPVDVVMTADLRGSVPYAEPGAKDTLSGFSSRGPRGTDSKLKPEITAPGGSIFAAAMGSGSGGTSMNGTSMAAPHVAGVAALMVEAHPDWTPEEIKAAMMNTAVDLADGSPIPQQGAGRVDAYRAVSTPVHAVGDKDFVSISDYFATDQGTHVIARPVTLHNTDTMTHTYAVGWESPTTSLPGLDVTFSANQVVVGPAAMTNITATFTFMMTELPADVGELEEVYGNIIFTPPPLHRLYLPLVMTGSTTAAAAAVRPQGLVGPEDTLRVPFYFAPRPYNELEITAQTTISDIDTDWASFEITHTGPITSSLYAYPLLVADAKETGTAGDIKAVGVDYGWTSGNYGPILTFAINAWSPWHLPLYYFAEFDIYIDGDEDGVDDYVIYNAPVAGTNFFIPRIINLTTFAGASSPYAIYVDYNSGYMELYVPAVQLGLGATNSTFNFQVYGYDQYGVEDESAPGRFDYARYPFAWDDDTLEPGPADRTAEIEVWVNDAEGYAYSMPKGVMIVDYTGNPDNGGETYLFDVTVDLALDLTVLHTNDFHAHVDEYNVNGARCKPADAAAGLCIAGAPRLATAVQAIRDSKPNVLLLDAGDQFQGTLFFNLFKGDVLTETMNYLGYDAMTLGNHEFDSGPQVLADFIAGTKFPVVSANIDATAEPALNGKIAPYTLVTRGGHKVGIIGLTTPETPSISSPGANIVFKDPAASLQATADELKAKGVNKIIALTHLGYTEDVALAGQVTGVDIILGGHSHSFLYNPATPQNFTSPALALTPVGLYPTVVGGPTAARSAAAEPVLVATAYQWGTFLGDLDVSFDPSGVLTAWNGNPIYMSSAVAKDATLDTLLQPYRDAVAVLIAQQVGETTVDLPITVGGTRICRFDECLMGNLVADAMLAKANAFFPGAGYQIAFQNGGGLRAPIAAGDVSMGDVMETLPFGNAIATMELKGEYVKSALENGALFDPASSGRFAQVAGMRYVIDKNQAVGSRITSVEVWDGTAWEALDLNAMYKVVTNDFMRRGSDGYTMFRDNAVNPYDFGPALDEALANYFMANSPVTPVIEGRITFAP